MTSTPRTMSPELQAVLQQIADDVVESLDCVGAMVAPLEGGNTLPVRAYAVGFDHSLLQQLEERLGASFLSSNSVAYLDDPRFKDNLSIRAIAGADGHPQPFVVSDSLYDLFRPIVNRPLSALAQRMTGIRQVIAIPFFLEDEVVGNLFAASRKIFTKRDIDFLTALGRQAAIAIQSQRRLAGIQTLERLALTLQANMTDEAKVLDIIVQTVVQELGYIGAMVATLERGNMLPVRAYAVKFSTNLLDKLERQLGVSLVGPKSVAYLDDERFKDNLSFRAVRGSNGRPANFVVSDRLYDLFRPVVNETLAGVAQKITGIQQVIAVPFFLGDEVVGNLFVASRKALFSRRETEILTILAQQAAVCLRNARMYRSSEERRQIAQIFAKMAFNSTMQVHALRNHIGAFRIFVQLLQPQLEDELYQQVGQEIMGRLKKTTTILDNLHKPWQVQNDRLVRVNDCLRRVAHRVVIADQHNSSEKIKLNLSLEDNLPLVNTSPDMLTEAFRILVSNAVQAIQEKYTTPGSSGQLWIESGRLGDSLVQVTIRDSGTGIKAEDLDKVFELRWSTKEAGMGFGLFWTKEYVQGLAGRIEVESVWQEGTTFRLTLPARLAG
ncbi:MAG TPA: GAF domain-containing protein [Anaerolineae bacterium]|nr:GAF domain-containing protein [Anaerolineae bacterium]